MARRELGKMGQGDNLSAAELRSLLGCIRELHGESDLESVPVRFMAAARRLVACDYAAYEELNPTLRRTIGANDPPEVRPSPEILSRFAHYASRGEHPIIGHWMSHPKKWRQAVSISQIKSRADYHRSGIYNDVYKRFETEDQAGIRLTADGPLLIALAVARSKRGFSDRDRLCLELLRPHLVQAYGNAIELARLRAEASASHQVIEAATGALVRLDAGDSLAACSALARKWLEKYARPWRTHSRLPERIGRWLNHHRQALDDLNAQASLVLEGDASHLTIRLVWDRPGAGSLLLLQEQASAPASLIEQRIAALPPRLGELLGHLLAGDGEKQAATKMRLSRNTVHNYVTELYRRLEVSSRPELMVRYLSPNGERSGPRAGILGS